MGIGGMTVCMEMDLDLRLKGKPNVREVIDFFDQHDEQINEFIKELIEREKPAWVSEWKYGKLYVCPEASVYYNGVEEGDNDGD